MSGKGQRKQREESPWVMVARYSEIGFMIPASVIAGYILGLLGDHLLHTHWIYLAGIIVGAIAGFAAMIRRALEASHEDDPAPETSKQPGDGSDGGN